MCKGKGQKSPRHLSFTKTFILHQDNARPHTAYLTQEFFTKWKIEVLEHRAYSPDSAPCDFRLFLMLKTGLRGRDSTSDHRAVRVCMEIFKVVPLEDYEITMKPKWVQRWKWYVLKVDTLRDKNVIAGWFEQICKKKNSKFSSFFSPYDNFFKHLHKWTVRASGWSDWLEIWHSNSKKSALRGCLILVFHFHFFLEIYEVSEENYESAYVSRHLP